MSDADVERVFQVALQLPLVERLKLVAVLAADLAREVENLTSNQSTEGRFADSNAQQPKSAPDDPHKNG